MASSSMSIIPVARVSVIGRKVDLAIPQKWGLEVGDLAEEMTACDLTPKLVSLASRVQP